MELTEKQKEGLRIAVERYHSGESYTVISGYAGSGKSTLVRFIISALEQSDKISPKEDVVYCAFTGKAAEVLRQKGNPNCKTAHKLLYTTRPTPSGGFVRTPKEVLDCKIVVLDECSMLPKDMTELLLSYDVYVIFCGDPGQLPPIDKTQDNGLLQDPHIFLDEIMRQAQESGIIQLSMKIRNGESIDGFRTDDVMVLNKKDFDPTMLIWADQTLCATNKTRNYLNAVHRKLLGYEKPIEEGEKLIAIKNDWDLISDLGGALTNGCVGTLHNMKSTDLYLPNYFKFMQIPNNKVPEIVGDFITDFGDTFEALACDKQCIVTGVPALTNKQKFVLNKKKIALPDELTYGYCITTHKAQGSEWDKVLIIEEGFPYDREEHKRWLYTAVTRAAKKVVIIRP